MTATTLMTRDDLFAVVRPIAARVARTVIRDFAGYTDSDDLEQELCVWALKREPKVRQWLTPTVDDPTCEIGRRSLHTTFRRVARQVGRKAKSVSLGQNLGDVFAPASVLVEELLADAVVAVDAAPGLDVLSDVKRAFYSGTNQDRSLLWAMFIESPPVDDVEVAARLGVNARTLDRRIDSAIGRLVQRVRDARPDFGVCAGRQAMSNAAAHAATGAGWND